MPALNFYQKWFDIIFLHFLNVETDLPSVLASCLESEIIEKNWKPKQNRSEIVKAKINGPCSFQYFFMFVFLTIIELAILKAYLTQYIMGNVCTCNPGIIFKTGIYY